MSNFMKNLDTAVLKNHIDECLAVMKLYKRRKTPAHQAIRRDTVVEALAIRKELRRVRARPTA